MVFLHIPFFSIEGTSNIQPNSPIIVEIEDDPAEEEPKKQTFSLLAIESSASNTENKPTTSLLGEKERNHEDTDDVSCMADATGYSDLAIMGDDNEGEDGIELVMVEKDRAKMEVDSEGVEQKQIEKGTATEKMTQEIKMTDENKMADEHNIKEKNRMTEDNKMTEENKMTEVNKMTEENKMTEKTRCLKKTG